MSDDPDIELWIACRFGRLDLALPALSRGADPTLVLHTAVGRRDLPFLQLLLSNGADVHDHDDLAVRAAVANGHHDVVELLLRRGADPRGLCYAANHGDPRMLRRLLEEGAEPTEAMIRLVAWRRRWTQLLMLCDRFPEWTRVGLTGEARRRVEEYYRLLRGVARMQDPLPRVLMGLVRDYLRA